ncbi:hypothetical protein DESC_520024 [Desulfosarcina cetonica]|nr:hypothetical protein DESC_520024 [Desulfosarcina cetonica]
MGKPSEKTIDVIPFFTDGSFSWIAYFSDRSEILAIAELLCPSDKFRETGYAFCQPDEIDDAPAMAARKVLEQPVTIDEPDMEARVPVFGERAAADIALSRPAEF